MPTALFVHHDANSEVGLLGTAAERLGFGVVEHFICDDLDSGVASRPFPSLDGVDLLVLLGSRWSVYDSANVDTWIDDEVSLIAAAVAASVPVLGVCFGAQVLAHALGGSVQPATREEIGWYDVEVAGDPEAAALAERFAIGAGPWFQWHLDVFTPPPGATTLARSAVGPQAFVTGRALGVQFHPEVNRSVLETWMVSDRDQLVDSGIDPDALLRRTDDLLAGAMKRCEALLNAVVERL